MALRGLCRCPLCAGAWLALALSACAPVDDMPPDLTRFTPRPIAVQYALDECPDPHCEDSLTAAISFWRAQSVSMVADPVDLGATSQLGIAVPGVIAVRCGKLATWPKRVHGETSYLHSIGGNVLAAEIVLASCEEHAVAHEIAHALMGPEHRDERDNLMHSELPQAGWALDADQVAAARD